MNNSTRLKLSAPKFSLGRLFATANASHCLLASDIFAALARHGRGDWGDLCEEDRKANERALIIGERLFSIYYSLDDIKFYIITEWDRSLTTVLLPEDY